MPSRPSSVGGYVPIFPAHVPPLVWPPMARRRLFCALVHQGGNHPKKQNRRKGRLQARIAILALGGVSIFPPPKTPHRGRQRPAQGIKQPRPAPSWSKPGYYYLFRARESTAQRSAVWSYQAQYLPRHFTTSLASLRPISWTSCVHWPDIINGHSRLPSKSSAIVV